MSLIESEDSFKKRCNELKDALFDKFATEGIRNFSTLAFAFGSRQNPVADNVFTQFVEKLFGGATIGDSAILRRVHFEATTLLLPDLKSQAASIDASEPVRKLPFIEKQLRLEKQKLRIAGLLHKPDQQPAHSLIGTVQCSTLMWLQASVTLVSRKSRMRPSTNPSRLSHWSKAH